MIQKHKRPKSYTISRFVEEALKKYSFDYNLPCLDMPSGFGRHSIYLSKQNFKVISADYDIDVFLDGWCKCNDYSCTPIILDANKPLPFKKDTFSLILIVDFYSKELFKNLHKMLVKDGLIIYESYGAHGENWKYLPEKLEIRNILEKNFKFEMYKENLVGPDKANVTLKMIARKL